MPIRRIIGRGRAAGRRAPASGPRSRPSRTRPSTARAAAAASCSRRSGSAISSLERRRERRGVPGRDEPRRRHAAPTSEKPPTSPSTIGLPKASPAWRTPGLLDLAVGEGEHVGAPHQRRDLGIGDEARQEAHRPRRPRGQLPQRLERHPRHPRDPELGAGGRSARTPRAACRLPCRGAAGRRRGSPAPRRRASSGGSGSSCGAGSGSRAARAGSRGPRSGSRPTSAASRSRRAVGVDDDRVEALEQPALPRQRRRRRPGRAAGSGA